MSDPLISVVTVCYNASNTILRTLASVQAQTYVNLEYIVIDGGSTDGTPDLIRASECQVDTLVSEKDKGMYDALNKGIALCNGSIIGLLHADDVFASPDVLKRIAHAFQTHPGIQAVIGDIQFQNAEGKTIRTYSSSRWKPSDFRWGYMPPHPSFYCRKECFDRHGTYRLDFEIAADYELLIRFLWVHRLAFQYIPMVTVRMLIGGKSTRGLQSTLVINREIAKACRINGMKTSLPLLYLKYIRKIAEFF